MAGVMVEYALGQSSPEVQFLDSTTVVTICGNALRFQQLSGGTQDTRFLWGAGRGISAFTVNTRKGLVAYAEKGLNPCIFVHDSQSLDLLTKLSGKNRVTTPPFL
ncbi:hypothetical protein KFL_001680140 [Klebsormidium nitens]|uniref:Uncharacterized protein n=1 Tax=Klebsormidium nitens TaxID=105231 RepID=A0A1Y1I3D4_KLENI|nr:hypothetical protein KFL_001680140 [Klebsormidium nitens]|eukprot:GAQ83919.1 hypothetical protein KFL_001680140 [Klebsormidium nitens]